MDVYLLILVSGGIAGGIISTVFPMGPVPVLSIRRGLLGDFDGALWIGLGRIPAECLYCVLAAFGVSALLEQVPGARLTMEVMGVVAFVAIGVWLAIQEPKQIQEEADPDDPNELRRRRYGNWVGFVISILNPSLILSWSAGVGFGIALLDFRPELIHKIGLPVGLAVGIALGCVIQVALLRRYGPSVGLRSMRVLFVAMGVLFIGLGLWNAVDLIELL